MGVLYDSIGSGYRPLRRPDPRIAAAVQAALGDAARVVNVGAGAGSYEPADRYVVAVELATTMIRQRPAGSAPAVQASAVALPFVDAAFDASLAILTVHHWTDRAAGLLEMRRVASERTVVLTWDPEAPGFWLTYYFPEILEIDRRIFPSLAEFELSTGSVEVSALSIPHDCSDGFLGAYWRRPESYLDATIRSAISTFSKIRELDSGLARLRSDLESGRWNERYGAVLEKSELDLGYRLLVAR